VEDLGGGRKYFPVSVSEGMNYEGPNFAAAEHSSLVRVRCVCSEGSVLNCFLAFAAIGFMTPRAE